MIAGWRADPRWAGRPAGPAYTDVTDTDTDADDHVYLLTRSDGQVIVRDPEGGFVRSWGRGMFTTPHGLTVGPDGSVYCVDAGDHTVRRFTPTGELLAVIGTAGTPSDTGYTSDRPVRVHSVERVRYPGDPFNRCTALAVAPNGELYVADGYGNCRVHRFTADGELIGSWGSVGTGPGEFHLPHGIDIGPDARVYVADRENDRIQIFSPDGEFLEQWTDLQRPCDLVVGRDGTVSVVELWRPAGTRSFVHGEVTEDLPSRLSVLDAQGRPQTRGHGSFIAPHGIARDSTGALYVAEVTHSFAIATGRVGPEYADQLFTRLIPTFDEETP
ncbi:MULTISPECIES: peptidyl-alpha-hydroxyglycine alpha-amidating lyase family protein [Pseudonocardia]|uniref:Virginiamycin B lyase n=2 Tax=Pseudonocardia TaxID=1847 RepID=A0A1Y2MKE3_PSEAH|nr:MULTISPECIES: peptidyl-alpha-hydroxyglycine alpha-amidating lyase family protein [Pseudonocardia]OSY35733.1 Virginiamycin B lyase [Pseudonocardia autotrophica]TDN74575.1 NHL repeat-containing protein [Pseudonocardia autotrophica]BBG05343.1 hypothetical protein Pdca_65520 [Pseudonocardia autotrophica]GEC27467.1 hypothetical protein PSA01_44960 [Pseudonocardia saturnea]